MSARQIEQFEPGSQAWSDQRRTMLGGSEIAAVLGLSPFESPFSLWHRKAGSAQPKQDVAEMDWGRRLEPVVLAKWIESHSKTHAGEPWQSTWVRDDWMIASPDHLSYTRDASNRLEVVEIKTSPYGEGWGKSEDGADGVPVYYLTQVRWYLGVLGLQRAHVAVLVSGYDYREYVVDQDEEDLRVMIAKGREFLDSLEQGQQPGIDDHSETLATVRQMHPDIDSADAEVPAELAQQYREAVRAAKAAERAKQQQTAAVLHAMGDARNALDPDGQRIAYREARPRKDGTPGTPYLKADRSVTATPKPSIREAAA